jgi:predicted amidohydrolase YtcJ
MRIDETIMKERRLPTKDSLDKVVPENLVWLPHVAGHASIVNSKTLRSFAFPPDIVGVDRHPEMSQPTSVLRAAAHYATFAKDDAVLDEVYLGRMARMSAESALKVGLGTVYAWEEGDFGEKGLAPQRTPEGNPRSHCNIQSDHKCLQDHRDGPA